MSKESAAPRRGLAVAVLIFTLAAPAVARSAPGDLDPSFGTDGKVTARVVTEPQAGVTAHDATAALMLPDGRMLVVGSALTGDPGWSVVMARFLPDGAADPSFGVDGKVLALSAFSFRAFAAALQPDGKIVVAGSSGPAVAFQENLIDVGLARFNPDGSLDASFGNGGVVITNVFNNEDRATAVAILADGRIVIGGFARTFGFGSQYEFLLARYLPDGQRDVSFGVNGIRTTDFFGSWDFVHAIAVQPDGKIVAAGEVKFSPLVTLSSNYMSVGLARYHADGQLDLSFGEGGKVHTEFFDELGNVQHAAASSVVLQDDGKILVAGHVQRDDQTKRRDVILARYLPDGSLDPRFGTGGRVDTDLGRVDDAGNALLLQPDGKIVVSGDHATIDAFTTVSDNHNFLVQRYQPNGTLDPAFGSAGSVVTEFSTGLDFATAILQQADAKLVAAGAAGGGFGLARYLNPAPIAVAIDIQPGVFPNTVNLGSGGKVAVAIFGGPDFDATTIDPATVTLASATPALKGKDRLMATVTDVDRDGFLDLVLHMEVDALYLETSDTVAIVEGRTTGGVPFRGADTIRVLP
jgi:uncharacterized delta-60 repeat protein